jgi:hypothetical protein
VNRALLMLSVLRDGKPHTRRDIFERVGFQLTNNSASELRAMGYDVQQSRERVDGVNVYSYQLQGSLSESGRAGNGPGGSVSISVPGGAVEAPDSESEFSLPEPALSASPPGHGLNDPDSGRAGSESEWLCRCGSTEYRHVTDDIFRCNGCNARADIFSRQLPLEGVA